MKTTVMSTRRLFFWKAGAALSAPLAAVAASASGGNVDDVESLKTRLAELENLNAIRDLHQAYARHVNARAHGEVAALFVEPSEVQLDATVCSLTADASGEGDIIELAVDRETAVARFHCVVQLEVPIEPGCTLVEMARLQGDGFVRWSERRVLENIYVKRDGSWKIERSAYRRV
jgi:hypothetical protein